MVKSSAAHLDKVFHALSDPTRRAILRDVAGKQRTIGEIARPFKISLAAISKHLTVLEKADLVMREKRGSFQVIHLNAHAMKRAEEWLQFYQRFWNDKLNVLRTLLEGEDNE